MKLEKEKVRSEKYYRIGYISIVDKYILANVVPWIAWYDRYYEITKEEYDLFELDIESLDNLAEKLYKCGVNSEHFLFSEKKEENAKKEFAFAKRLGVTWR